MRPEDVPAELVEKAARARINAQWGRPAHRPIADHEWAAVRSGIEEKWMAAAIAAVLPEIQAQAAPVARVLETALAWEASLLDENATQRDEFNAFIAHRGAVTAYRAARLTATTEEPTT